MRTTLDIDDDVLQAAKERGRRENRTAGQVISELARAALNSLDPLSVVGFSPFPKRGAIITNERIDKLREADTY